MQNFQVSAIQPYRQGASAEEGLISLASRSLLALTHGGIWSLLRIAPRAVQATADESPVELAWLGLRFAEAR